MNVGPEPSPRALDDCGCGAGTAPRTPLRIDNPPGRSRINYRVGTYGLFLESMLSRIAGDGHPALSGLTTRAPDDPAIALLHACAAVDDVLTFYQERIAHEAYLRTAVERRSLVKLAALLGYRPKPGVSAAVHLAFTVESTPGSPDGAPVPAGTRVQSIPGPDELPRSFETSEAIEARAAWNAIGLRADAPQEYGVDTGEVTAVGLDLALKPGDRILIVEPGDPPQQEVKQVVRVAPDPASMTTRIELGGSPTTSFLVPALTKVPLVPTATRRPLDDLAIGEVFSGNVFSQGDVHIYALAQNWSQSRLARAVNRRAPPTPGPGREGVYAFRRRASIYGHNAPRWADLPQVVQGKESLIPGRLIAPADLDDAQYPEDWDNNTLADEPGSGGASVDLDNVYPAMVPGGWLVLQGSGDGTAFEIEGSRELSRSDYAMSAKVTRLKLKGATATELDQFGVRETSAFGESEKLALARLPLPDPLTGDSVTLDGYYPGLEAGRPVILTGARHDLADVVESEVATIKEVLLDGALEPGRLYTRLVFEGPLAHPFVLRTVRLNANAVLATHGEGKAEVLGGGDAREAYPEFALRSLPLTYTGARTPSGVRSSLEVRVDGVRWEEVPYLYGHREEERVYEVERDDDGTTRVRFNGRLPTGQENVRASYRSGIGSAGLVHADQVSLLAIRPLGVRGVTNPLPSSGAADPEPAASLRRNLPLAVLTLDRLVSLRDYEDFARGFAGFAKAHVTYTVDGATRGIFVTVAGEGGAELGESSEAFGNLVDAMARYGDPNVPLLVRPYVPLFFQVEAAVRVHPDRLEEEVLEAVRSALRARFSFDAREFGRPVAESEVIALIQGVDGVDSVDLNALFLTGEPGPLPGRLVAPAPPRGVSRAVAEPARLLLLDPRPIAIGVAP